MEKFITPEEIERAYGVRKETLTQWRANLIGPDFIKWKDRILYHSEEIEGWFKIENLDLETKPKPKVQPEPKTQPKPEVEPVKKSEPPKPEKEPRPKMPSSQPELFTPTDIEERYQISAKTLANWRSLGKGPRFFKLGNAVRYKSEEVEKWLARSRIRIYGEDD